MVGQGNMRQRKTPRWKEGDKVKLRRFDYHLDVTVVGIDRGYIIVKHDDGKIERLTRSEIVD